LEKQFVELIALKNFSPDGVRSLKKGQRFEISSASARFLIATHRATIAIDDDIIRRKREYKRRDLQAER
jgi:hypothetical protein